MFSIYRPDSMPPRGLITSLKAPQLPEGYYQALSCVRFDKGVFRVRDGISTISNAVAPGAVCLGAWSGALNGTVYVVAAYVVGGVTCIYSLNLSTGVFSELTVASANPVPSYAGAQGDRGNPPVSHASSAGGTRLTGSITARVNFTAHTLPRRVIAGATVAPVDVLSIHNLEDYPLIYSPSMTGTILAGETAETFKLYRHKNIAVPSGCTSFIYFPRFSAFLQVADTTGNKKYVSQNTARTALQARYTLADTSTAPYNGSVASNNFCLLLTNAASLNGDQTIVTFPATTTLPGEQVNILVEGNAANLFDLMNNKKGEFGAQITTPTTITAITNAVPGVVTAAAHGLTNGQEIIITSVGGATQYNGNFYVGSVTTNTFVVYDDSALTVAINGGGYTAGGSVVAVQFYTYYDSASSDATLAINPSVIAFDTGGNRAMYTYRMNNIPNTARSVKYWRLTRNGANASTLAITILGIASAGLGNGFYGDSVFWCAWSDRYSYAEGLGFEGSAQPAELLKNTGGPTVVTSGASNIAGTRIPTSPTVLYDWKLHLQNAATYGTIYGGLEGTPNTLDIYVQTGAESVADTANPGTAPALYWTSIPFYSPATSGGNHFWILASTFTTNSVPGGIPTGMMDIKTETYGYGSVNLIDRNLRDPGVPVPSAFNIAMPRCGAIGVANQRTFTGQIKDTSDAKQRGDMYISRLGFPFRFQSVQDANDPDSGTRAVFTGQIVQGVVMVAAGAEGASIIYVLTDQFMCALGTAGGFVGSGYDATSLSTIVQIDESGTNEPGSIQQYKGLIFYIDKQGQIIQFASGRGSSISRNTVDDKTLAIPASLRGKVVSSIFRDRYCLGYPPASGTGNTHLLGWNLILQTFEFDDTLPSTVAAQQMIRVYDSTQVGPGQRLVMFSGADLCVYGFEEGSTEPGNAIGPLLSIATKGFQSPDDNLIYFGPCQFVFDQVPQVSAADVSLNIDAYYDSLPQQFRGTIDLTLSGSARVRRTETRVRTEITSTGTNQEDYSGYLQVSGHVPCGTILWAWTGEFVDTTKAWGVRP